MKNHEVAEEENFYTEDPKKALYIFMENRGDEPVFEVEEEGPGHSKFYHARVRLPVYIDESDPNQALYGRGSAGKKREAERLAALDACIKLDKAGVLRGDNDGESIARNKRLKAILDDYDSDENLFYDPAAEAEKDRRNKKKQKRGSGKVETFDSLKLQSEQIQGKMLTLTEQMSKLDCQQATDADDEFAELMGSLKKDQIEKDKKTLTSAYEKLALELKKVTKLIEIVAPGQAVQVSAPVVPALNTIQPIPTAQEPKLPPPVKEQSITTKSVYELKTDHAVSSDDESDPQEDARKPEIEEEIESWVPPEGQTGDGRTFLNEKFGY
ncbi:hypothetical protein DSO57_1035764 [Entomophthora muscae]|uniref:Uncharacterized protein n=1 Tax=Entomophthora muscae TaxID=34485 RepID=A0ACC2SCK0_9FUNG|nr:hypothetical protein DSO57_1035764 [Entomophthora muscae]